MMKKSLNCRGRLLDLSTPRIMAIMNLTPDSFFDGGNLSNEKEMLGYAEKLITQGADIIDIGGQSTRPGATFITPEEEWSRLEKGVEVLTKTFPETIFSIDTFYSAVAENAIDAGVAIVNDISAGTYDDLMIPLISQKQVPYIIMHIKGSPQTMQADPQYENVTKEVIAYFSEILSRLRQAGINDVILDPGFGFGKSVTHNYSLLKNLRLFSLFELPVLAGVSRKSLVTKVLNCSSREALNGTTVLNTLAILNGASIIRVHDVKEAVEVKKIIQFYQQL
jgi:dihydropteroate synthase